MRGAAESEGKRVCRSLSILHDSGTLITANNSSSSLGLTAATKLQGTPLCADTTRWQIALIWMEVIKSCKLDLWLELGGDKRVKASDLGPVLRLKQAG